MTVSRSDNNRAMIEYPLPIYSIAYNRVKSQVLFKKKQKKELTGTFTRLVRDKSKPFLCHCEK